MPKQCAICEKQYTMVWRRVKLRGKFNPTIKRKQKPNLQWVKLTSSPANKSAERVLACTKCIKALAKRK